MTVESANGAIVLLSASWLGQPSELSFATRSVAGAASRLGAVTVLTPMQKGVARPDGAFDVLGIGSDPDGGWPSPTSVRDAIPPAAAWIVDRATEGAHALVGAFADGQKAYSIERTGERRRNHAESHSSIETLDLVPTPGSRDAGLHVPINPLAAGHRHMGLGFTGYILVLTDRPDTPHVAPPTAAVGWLTSRFYEHHVVVLEGGTASAWKGRALRGTVPVDTRTDFWRLVAHAQMTVDLRPGDVIARECIESLRFGTPIVVPAGTVASRHAESGGGLVFTAISDLFECVCTLLAGPERKIFSRAGSLRANESHGDPASFVRRLARTLDLN